MTDHTRSGRRRTRLRRAALTAVLTAAAAALSPAVAPAAAAPTACPSTFSVLHDDRIGALAVPAGPYTLTVADPERLSCAHAADAFRRFLEDWDGRLPRPWTLDAATAGFSAGPGVAFRIARADAPSGGGGGQHPATGARCPGVFQVLYDDRIGSFRVPAGPYTLTLLSVGPLTCERAARRFAAFLQDFDGRLPRPWVLDRRTGAFLRGGATVGFRVERATMPPPSPDHGGAHPAGRRCPGTFRVLHDDRIGRLRLPAGRYRITLASSGRPGCAASARALARFLQRPSGRLPRPWRMRATTGTFSRGPGVGFRVKPAGLVSRSR